MRFVIPAADLRRTGVRCQPLRRTRKLFSSFYLHRLQSAAIKEVAMRFIRLVAIVFSISSGFFLIYSLINLASLNQSNAANVQMWNDLARQTTDKTERVFFQLQILEAQYLQVSSQLELSLSAIMFLLALILLSISLRKS